ncbi:uncharacterized protein LOC133689413 [Populus nigra]|uniref:uncharacterized protein LOC133689413 n=1 Tax=Populus nigra TaxID=3691 RepID=UPI002B264BCC|nr:uncharacterized protein LOC133689413 [Populus nigra]
MPAAPFVFTSQNLEANPSLFEQQSTTNVPPAQVSVTVNLTADDPHMVKFSKQVDYEKLTALEDRLRVVEGADLYDPVHAAKMCLVPNVVVPKEFRVPEFIKYTGTECPVTHLKSYCNKMAEVVNDEKLLIHFFQDSLSGSYKFNMEVAPDRSSLLVMEKGNKETVREYTLRWREKASHVQPSLLEKEMVTLFSNTFKSPYFEHLVGSSAQHFYDAVTIAERIEQAIRMGRMLEPTEKKGFTGKKKDSEMNNVEGVYKGKKKNYHHYNFQIPTQQVASVNFTKPFPTNQQNPPNDQQSNQIVNPPRRNFQRTQERLPPLPLPLGEMYSKLLSIGQVAPVPLTPLQPPYPNWYKPDLTCEYHAGIVGHNIESCNAFKNKLLQLIKAGWITFDDAPNVNSNHLPNHTTSSGGVNVVGVEDKKKRVLKVSMERLYGMIVQSGYLPEEVKRMLTFGMIRIESEEESSEVGMIGRQEKKVEVCRLQPTMGGPPKLILTKPVCTNSGSYGTMPYNYGYSFNIKDPTPIFHTEIGGLTRSGRCFTPEELERQRKAKGKEIVDAFKGMEVNKPISEDESNEFLKLMKHSEYSMVDQLKKTPARISLMSLILSSELHRKALQKVLNEAYVPQDITQDTMEHLVGRIQASNYLYFTEDELDPEGTGHNKPLYITVKCKNCLIGKVLVDNGSALNVLPRHMLDEMPIDATYMRPSTMTARAYDGSPRQVIGTIDIELFVGPQMFLVTLQVMDIHPSYSMLLGRPWIHASGAVTSSLHQCLKYIINGTLVKVKAEETLSMIRNVSVPYIEAEDCKDGNLHAFEIVNTEWVPENMVLRRPIISDTSRMIAKCFLKHGLPFQNASLTGSFKGVNMMKVNAADQRFGLGFKPKKYDYKRAARIK